MVKSLGLMVRSDVFLTIDQSSNPTTIVLAPEGGNRVMQQIKYKLLHSLPKGCSVCIYIYMVMN